MHGDGRPSTEPPFVGRITELAELEHLLDDGRARGAVLRGPAGIGKSRLAETFALRHGALTLLRLVGTPATTTVPYAAFAHLIDDETGLDNPFAVLATVRRSLGDGRTLLMVDDIALLDDASLSLCTQLLAADDIFLLATQRSEHPTSSSLEGMVRAFDLRRIEVAPLDAAALGSIAAAVLGTTLDGTSLDALRSRSDGNPLYAVELLRAAVDDDRLEPVAGGKLHLNFATAAGALRLHDLLGERLDNLPDDLLDTLRFIAVAEPLTIDDLDPATLLPATERLEQMGRVRVQRVGEQLHIRIAQPMHRDVLLTGMTNADYRAQAARAAAVIGGRRAAQHDDALRIAIWQLDAGLDTSADILLRGAKRARAALDLTSTVRLARAAHQQEASLDALHLLAEALFLEGRFAEVELLDVVPDAAETNLVLAISYMMLRMDNVFWGQASSAKAVDVVERYRPFFAARRLEFLLDPPLAFIHAHDGRSAQALHMLGETPADDGLFLMGSLARTAALCAHGRFDEVIAVCERALKMLAAAPDPNAGMSPVVFILQRAFAFNELGQFDDTIATCEAAYAEVVDHHIRMLRCMIGLAVGAAHLRKGDVEQAAQWYAETVHATQVVRFESARRAGLAGLASVAGHTRDRNAAEGFLTELEAPFTDIGFGRSERSIGSAWALWAVGRHDEATAGLRRAAVIEIEADEPVAALRILLEAARLGDEVWARDQLDQFVTAAVEGPFHRAAVRFITSAAEQDPDGLLACAESFAELGARVLAAEAASLAARHLEAVTASSAVVERRLAAARAMAAAQRRRCPGVATPALAGSVEVALSAREREIARLAADGHSSKDIAATLFLSARTVENHLQRVYAKLGVAGRAELADAPLLRTSSDGSR